MIEGPQELGRTLFRSSAKFRMEIPDYQLQALAAHSSVREQNQRVQPRYRQAKETKCDGMAAGRHSVLIVPTKLANSTRLEPTEESGTPIHGTVLRNTTNASKFDNRVHETGTDSSVGETVA